MAKQAIEAKREKVHPIPSVPPSAAKASSVPPPRLEVESVPQVNFDAIAAAFASAAEYAANVEGRKPTKAEVVSFASPAVERATIDAYRLGFDTPPRFEPTPPVGVGRNVLICSALAKKLQATPGVRKDSNGNVKAGNAALLLALAVARDTFPSEPIASATVKRIAAAIFAPEKSGEYRSGPGAWFDGYFGTSRARGLLVATDGEIK